jgi:hypothetical protein
LPLKKSIDIVKLLIENASEELPRLNERKLRRLKYV